MRRLLSALAAVAMIGAFSTGAVLASHALSGDNVAPNSNSHEFVEGNPKCGAAPAGGINIKIEAEDLGVGNYGPIRITAYDGKHVSWAIRDAFLNTYDANLVIVKGGPNAIIYHYDTFDDWDTDLTAPVNPNNGKYYGISHVDFCFDKKAGT
jgi:hypothetical protein